MSKSMIAKKLHFSIWKKKLAVCCMSWSHYVISSYFWFFRLLFLLFFFNLLIFFILFFWLPLIIALFLFNCVLFTIVRLIIFLIFPILLISLLFMLTIFYNYFHCCKLNSRNYFIFLALKNLFKLAREIIIFQIFIIVFINFHKSMTFINHMFSNSLPWIKIFCIFILACNT